MGKHVGNLSSIRKVLLLARSEIQEPLSMGEVLKAVEYTFKLAAEDIGN